MGVSPILIWYLRTVRLSYASDKMAARRNQSKSKVIAEFFRLLALYWKNIGFRHEALGFNTPKPPVFK